MELPVRRVHKVKQVLKEQLVHRVRKERLAHRELKVHKVRRVQPELMVQME